MGSLGPVNKPFTRGTNNIKNIRINRRLVCDRTRRKLSINANIPAKDTAAPDAAVRERLPRRGELQPGAALTRNRVELVPWSMAATSGPSMIRCEDAAMAPFMGSPRSKPNTHTPSPAKRITHRGPTDPVAQLYDVTPGRARRDDDISSRSLGPGFPFTAVSV